MIPYKKHFYIRPVCCHSASLGCCSLMSPSSIQSQPLLGEGSHKTKYSGGHNSYVWCSFILYADTYSKSMDQPCMVANLTCGQLNRPNYYFPVRVRALEFGLTRRVRQSRPASACSHAEPGAYLGDSSRVPRRRPLI